MIGRIQGIILEKLPPELVIDVNGVGYEINASMNTFYHLPEVGEKVSLHTHFVVREDAQLLYGFVDKEERTLFRTLIKVNGVGPKLALTILSSVTPMEFAHYVADNNNAALVKLPGVGKKTAERLIIEMRDKLKGAAFGIDAAAQTDLLTIPIHNSPEQEAISALIALGYKPQEASKAVSKVNITNLSSQEIIRQALKSQA
jgi:Holliday junction DNA helicase RuvA